MTEDEAKTKLCCGPAQIAAQFMGENVIKPHAMCAGSACMAWRWTRTPEQARLSVLGPDKDKVAAGFCGLAGKP